MKKLTIAACTMSLVVCAGARAFAYEDGDWQLWSTNSISGKLSDDLTVQLSEDFRFGDDIGEHYYHHADAGLGYRYSDLVSLGFNYRQIYEKKKGEWKREYRPHLNASFKWKWNDFDLNNRSRLEYRDRQDAEDLWRYRNKMTLAFPTDSSPLGLKPYLAGEFFLDLDEGIVDRYRLYGGLRRKLTESLSLDGYYLWQTTKKAGDWTEYNIIGVQLKFSF